VRTSEFPPVGDNPSPNNEGDFDAALDLADQLLALSEGCRERIALLGILISVFGAASFAALAFDFTLFASRLGTVGTRFVLLAVALGLAFLGWEVFIIGILPLRRRLIRDEATLMEILDVLRGVFPYVGKEEGIGFTRRASYQARLERFPILSGKSR
jgi:hypothetical protein